jgi:hypothetical protein
MLSGLRHLSVTGSDDNDGSIHGRSTSNHVLDVIGVTRTVDVSVVAVLSRVLDVSSGNSDTALSLLGSFVNGAIIEEIGEALLGLSFRDGCREGGLSIISLDSQCKVTR